MNDREVLISEIFSSVQGEGVFAGMYATFIRLQGCSVHCSFCDEKESWSPKRAGAETLTFSAISARVAAFKNPLIVITGGEPLEYPHLNDLCNWLRVTFPGVLLQLETSGLPVHALTAQLSLHSICVSPKMLHTPASHKSHVNPYDNEVFHILLRDFPHKVFLKLVIEDFTELLHMLLHLLPGEFSTAGNLENKAKNLPLIYVNPVDRGVAGNTDYLAAALTPEYIRCIELAQSADRLPFNLRKHMRFGLQLHKIFRME